MSKRTPPDEWYVAESDTQWKRWLTDKGPDTAPTTRGRLSSEWLMSVVVMIFLLLVSAGDWWGRIARTSVSPARAGGEATTHQAVAGVAQRSDRLVASASDNQVNGDWWLLHGREVSGLRAAIQAASQREEPAARVDIPLQSVEFGDEHAVVQVITANERGTPTYRQTRFYQRTTDGWQPTAPYVALWGPERSLETSSFIYHFRQNDAPAVIAVAPQVEALYSILQHNFGLSFPAEVEKLVIEVRITQTPGQAIGRFLSPIRFVVPSPAVYLAPVEMSDAELLRQSIALPLLNYLLGQACEQHAIGSAWQPLLNGIHLWQVWDLDLPLSVWREDVVKWIYLDVPTTRSEETVVI